MTRMVWIVVKLLFMSCSIIVYGFLLFVVYLVLGICCVVDTVLFV